MFTVVWGQQTVDMSITNNLEGKEDLNIHCQSKDNDLGLHLLHINQTFNWSFRTNLLGGTLFFCSFQWGNGSLLHFDVYQQSRDIKFGRICHWYIHKDGPCRYEVKPDRPPSEANRKCYKWN